MLIVIILNFMKCILNLDWHTWTADFRAFNLHSGILLGVFISVLCTAPSRYVVVDSDGVIKPRCYIDM